MGHRRVGRSGFRPRRASFLGGGPLLYSVVLLLTPPRRGEERGGSVQDAARGLSHCQDVQRRVWCGLGRTLPSSSMCVRHVRQANVWKAFVQFAPHVCSSASNPLLRLFTRLLRLVPPPLNHSEELSPKHFKQKRPPERQYTHLMCMQLTIQRRTVVCVGLLCLHSHLLCQEETVPATTGSARDMVSD